jgi:hypothetical protein
VSSLMALLRRNGQHLPENESQLSGIYKKGDKLQLS